MRCRGCSALGPHHAQSPRNPVFSWPVALCSSCHWTLPRKSGLFPSDLKRNGMTDKRLSILMMLMLLEPKTFITSATELYSHRLPAEKRLANITPPPPRPSLSCKRMLLGAPPPPPPRPPGTSHGTPLGCWDPSLPLFLRPFPATPRWRT